MYGSKVIFNLLLLLSICISNTSCLNSKSTIKDDFHTKTSLRWIAATGISWTNEVIKKDIQNNGRVNGIKGDWLSVFKIDFLDFNSSAVSDCLFYMEMEKESHELGFLKVVENPLNRPCSELTLEDAYSTIKDVANFSFKVDNRMAAKEHLTLMVDREVYTYVFGNFTQGQYGTNIFSSSVIQSKGKSLVLHSEISYLPYQDKKKSKVDGKVCFDVNDQCETKIKDTCSECINGWYEVLSNKCASHGRRICGNDNCGIKRKPACIRGHIAAGINSSNYCFRGSPSGFCSPGLTTACVNNILICE